MILGGMSMKITNDMINPEIRRAGRIVRKVFRYKSKDTFVRMQGMLNKVRRLMRPRDLQFEEQRIKTPSNPDLRLCLIKAKEPKPDAVGLLWFHGGGYGLGAPEQDVGFFRRFINTANCVIVSPDYRLAIDAPYPAALDDCYAALLWMQQHAKELGIRDDQLFVGGDSAGGGLAAAVSLLARDKGEVNIAFQMPLYPMLDDRMITPSSKENDAPIWDSISNEVGWKMYLGELYGTEDIPAYAAAARAKDFSNLPPTYTFVGDIEPFHDETKQYIADLQAAGVEAEIDVYEGCFHAFETMCPKKPIAQRAIQKYTEKFQYAAENYFAKQPQSDE